MMKRVSISLEKILLIIGGIFLLSALGCGVNQYWQNRVHDQMMNTLRIQVESITDNIVQTKGEKYVSPYEAIFAENPDCVAWLQIPGTRIDYPVMYTPVEEEYYLYRNFYGEEDKNGTLILAAASNIDQPSTNLLIHGHNMRNGEMFGELDNYKEESYASEHKEIVLYSKQREDHYEVVAAFYGKVLKETEEGFRYYRFSQAYTEEDFQDYYNNIKKLSLYDTGVTAEYGDEFITLSTCSNIGKTGRFVVVAKKIKTGL